MTFIKNDIWQIYKDYDAICCPCNRIVKKNCELVMGAGLALEFSKKYDWLAKHWGLRILKREQDLHPVLLVTLMNEKPHLIYFGTKWHWKDRSDLDLIIEATNQLCFLIDKMNWERVLLPKPGCGLGGLDWNKEVLPKIKDRLEFYPQIDIMEK